MSTTQDTWDLTDLYSGADDPRIARDRAAAIDAVDAFDVRWRDRLVSSTAAELCEALADFEEIIRLASKPQHYASLRSSLDGTDPTVQAELASAQTFGASINQKLAFWSVELKALTGEHLDGLPDSVALGAYRHYLDYQQLFAPFTLSEEAEQTVARKDLTGKTSWVNLYMQVTSGLQFEVEQDGEVQTMTRGELTALGVSQDRDLRARAGAALVEGFEPHRDVLGFVFNTLFEDHRQEMVTRGYDDPMHYPVLQDEVPRPVVDSLLETATSSFGLVHRYHAVRRAALEIDDYATHDLRVPAFGDDRAVPWDEARDLVLAAFDGFSPRASQMARPFFGGWVDAFPRPGKSSGAFCSPAYPPGHPWLLLNHADTMDDTFTLAHELGHGLHSEASSVQTPLNYRCGKAVAETASVFAEIWLHEHLMARTDDPAQRRRLLDRQVRDAVGTAFHQVAYINWERRAHAERAEGAVEGSRFCALWLEEMERLMGPDVLLTEKDSWRWVTIPHFVFARFYCYSYAFGKLLTLALHGLWKERGDAFVDQYLGLLAAGGSKAAAELVSDLGLDLADPGFWQRGCDVVAGWLDELEALAAD